MVTHEEYLLALSTVKAYEVQVAGIEHRYWKHLESGKVWDMNDTFIMLQTKGLLKYFFSNKIPVSKGEYSLCQSRNLSQTKA